MTPFKASLSAPKQDSILSKRIVYHLHRNQKGIWAATDKGLFLINKKEGILHHFEEASGDLPFNHIRHIHEDQEGVFWMATKGGGVIRWPPAAPSKAKQFTTRDGLANNYTYAVYEDDYGKLWIPSDNGLMCLNKSTNQIIRTFTTEDGLPHNEFNLSAHYQAKDGTLYFGGLGGIIAFHPKIFEDELDNETPLVFTAIALLEEDAEEMTDKTALLAQSKEISIQPSDKLFEVHFALLDFDAPERHQYAYKIEGFNNNWVYIQENYLRITSLPCGEYTLKIKGRNTNKGLSNQELSLDIHVLKPFYLQWWFITLVLLSLVVGIISVFNYRVKAFKRNQQRLEAEVNRRTRTIQQQAEALKELDKIKTRFFSNITHEFRTPLTLIIGPLQQFIAQRPSPTNFYNRLPSILKNADQLLNLVNQLLDLSKIEGKQMSVEAAYGDIIDYTKKLITPFQSLVDKKKQSLIFETNQDKWETNFDKDKWNKIINNLLSNAIKFTPEAGSIQLRLIKNQQTSQDFIQLEVKDSGVGINKNQRSKIFNRFYQADSSSTRLQEGTGIGLALVKELIELQGGSISVVSEVNKGTTFQIQLPVLHKEVTGLLSADSLVEATIPIFTGTSSNQLPIPTNVSTDNEKLVLLIVEDNEEMRAYIRHCIDASTYNIIEAVDGEDGIQKAAHQIPDLIISDIMMPKKDGFALTQAIRANVKTSHIPLILLTAKASLDSRLEGIQRGADVYLTKPFSPQELTLRIKKLIDLRQLLQKRYQNGLPTSTDKAYPEEDIFVTNLREFILENINNVSLNGDVIGKHFGMSRVHVYRKLKALTNQSISELVKAIRLEKAMELVKAGQLNVSEISWKTGFSSISHFSRSFKTAYGRSPSEFLSKDL